MQFSVIRQRSRWWWISGLVILSGLVAMFLSWQQLGTPLRLGLDFAGGTRLQLERDCSQPEICADPISPGTVREILSAQDLANSSIQILGSDRQGLLLRTRSLDVEDRSQLQTALTETLGQFDPQKTQIDTVGPVIGGQLLRSGLLALGVAFLGITLYLSVRFRLDYAVFALIAVGHDLLITLGIFAILGLAFTVEIDSLFIVALLTITGFSVNDTVVIYDRIRETYQRHPDFDIDQVVDGAVNQTLGRSINTTLTTLLTLVALFFFGGETLKDFALALIIGFTVGAYSSIFIASTLLARWREFQGHKQKRESRKPSSLSPNA